jgi:hypothetical protein
MASNNVETRLRAAETAIQQMEPSYRMMQGLQSMGHFLSAVITGSKALDTNLWGYEWSADSLTRIAVAAAAVDELIDSGKAGMRAFRGINLEQFQNQKSPELPELSAEQLSKLPTEVQAGYRALQAAKAAGRFVSAAIVFEAVITGDFGVLGQTQDSLIRLGAATAGVQQTVEGYAAAKDAITGRGPTRVE